MPLQRRTKFWFYPYGPSNSVNNLVNGLKNAKIIKRVGSTYQYRPMDRVVNWGCSGMPDRFRNVPCLNQPERVANATSKQRTFRVLQQAGIPHPECTNDKQVAQGWLQGGKVLGRDLDNGSQGRGISVYQKGSRLGDHKFYVRYFRKQREFRVHVFNGKVIFEQEKLQKDGAKNQDGYSKYIRSHDRGWCFAFHHLRDSPVPQSVKDMAIRAVAVLGLDFGAVDCGWNERDNAAVFEVNTAPGLEESSLEAYVKAFQQL